MATAIQFPSNMKHSLARFIVACAGILFAATLRSSAQTPDLAPKSVLDVMQRVGDWALAHPATNRETGWVQAVGDVGMMALTGISGDAKYRDAMLAKGETNGWQLAEFQGRKFHADDQAYGQVCAELYFLYRENKMIAPLRAKLDYILEHPTKTQSLAIKDGQEQWTWCDALFMAPPTWLRLYAATGDERYLNFAVTNWWRTTDYLYDQAEHLFFRDSSFFKKTEANGKKVFWSRGNGWVFAGTVRMLQYLPTNHPDRPRFEKLFKEMADKIVSLQQADGLWRSSLLDPESFPLKETSGSGFFTYGLAWGVNQGLLDRAKFEPAVRKGWSALVNCVAADGKLTHVQPVGSDPKKFAPESTEAYGVGAFLLAGSEVYRMAISENAKVQVWKVHNPGNFYRQSETVERSVPKSAYEFMQRTFSRLETNSPYNKRLKANNDAFSNSEPASLVVIDGLTSRVIDSQEYLYPIHPNSTNLVATLQKLLFQADFAPNEIKTYYILDARALAATPPPIVKTFARYVPERMDDFAWESDRTAHRMYGQALIKGEGTITSGIDAWIKKDHRLIMDEMYRTKHYHEDNGSEMDDYRVGKSCGDGGSGIWDGKKLHSAINYRSWKLITTGPVRSEFEVTYDAWDAGGGRMVSSTKRISIDAGSWLSKAQDTFASEDKSPLTVGVGLAERACPTNRFEFIANDLNEGWQAYWQPEDQPKGTMGVAVILPKGGVIAFTNDAPNLPDSVTHANVPQPTHEGYPPMRSLLAISQADVGKPFTYYFGACWDRSGDFTNHTQWENYVKRFAERRDQPLQVTVGN